MERQSEATLHIFMRKIIFGSSFNGKRLRNHHLLAVQSWSIQKQISKEIKTNRIFLFASIRIEENVLCSVLYAMFIPLASQSQSLPLYPKSHKAWRLIFISLSFFHLLIAARSAVERRQRKSTLEGGGQKQEKKFAALGASVYENYSRSLAYSRLEDTIDCLRDWYTQLPK